MCQVLQVSRSGYYEWVDRPESEQFKRRRMLEKEIRRVYHESNQIYGSPKVTRALWNQGISVSEKTVGRIMKENQLRSRTVKKYKATTHSKHSFPIHKNVLNRRFKVDNPNEVWVSDITYVHTKEGTLYVASVMDLFSRKIVGWHVDSRMTQDLVLTALDRAYHQQKPEPGLLHHSDQGSQYASHEYQNRLAQYQMKSSMSRKGNCYDNAVIESFHSVFKKECVYLELFATRQQAKLSIFEYIECFYNRKRIHSAVGYLSPMAFERVYFERMKSIS